MTSPESASQAAPARRPAPTPAATPRLVVCYRCGDDSSRPRDHELATQVWLARWLAALARGEFAGEFDPSYRYDRPLYFVPNDTLCGDDLARSLSIEDERALFGGVVPFPFVATKVITHELPAPGSLAPAGWSHEFGARVRDVVLPGATVFSRADARTAGEQLLQQGSLRLKDPVGVGGLGQTVVADREQLESSLDALEGEALTRNGIVLERNLRNVTTLSIGRVRVGELLATYYGRQRLTTDNQGRQVYGGSHLTLVRGDFETLLPRAPTDEIRLAIEQALVYHRAALQAFAGMFASRANYDIAQGIDDAGEWHSGVLEQSWRMGGASGAELAALQAFRDDPTLEIVTASTTEIYGPDPRLPPGARVCFSGIDPDAGPLTKFTLLEPHADP